MRNAPGECPQNESQFGPRRENSILHAVVPVAHRSELQDSTPHHVCVVDSVIGPRGESTGGLEIDGLH
jgi:hypothetical protein